MNKRAEKIIREQLINPYYKKDSSYIGVEIETYIVCLDKKCDTKTAICEVFQKLVDEYDFQVVIRGTDGNLVRVDNGVDGISCDYCYQLLEFSFGKAETIGEIAERFQKYYHIIMPLLKERGHMFTGMATNHFPIDYTEDKNFTMDPFYSKVREYVREYTTHKDPTYFYTMMASVQTHIDVNGEKLLSLYNLFNKLDFVRALLFANSLPNETREQNYIKYPDKLLCARDLIWDNQGLPNTGLIDQEFHTMDELVEHISNLKVFIEVLDGDLHIFEPITLNEYFEDSTKEAIGLSCFRSFEHVVLNNNHVLEVRSDCTQPVCDAFAPVAFNVGIAYKMDEAADVLEDFLKRNDIQKTNSELRYMAITNQTIAKEEELKTFLMKLYQIAKKGLEERGYHEENFIKCLEERIENGMSPALKTQQMRKEGISLIEVAKQFSEL